FVSFLFLSLPPSLPTRRSSDLVSAFCAVLFTLRTVFAGALAVVVFFSSAILNCLLTYPVCTAVYDLQYLLMGARDHYGTNRLFRSEEHTSELQSRFDLVCRLLL